MVEPILRPEDLRRWGEWMAEALAWSKTSAHKRRVEMAKRDIEQALAAAPRWCVMSSGGKDSTAMTHLVCTEMGLPIPVGSEKDDLDFPGEEEHLVHQAAQYGWDLHILRPPVSPLQSLLLRGGGGILRAI
jgi:3'-phosphoadenosine 5'-phosphosulfate sulfotransferase (PAPS reductase)/FAD synthetase